MAELVDALRSGRSGLMVVEVRVLFWAPKNIMKNLSKSLCLNDKFLLSVRQFSEIFTNCVPNCAPNCVPAGAQ